jgi:protocatechuate 3,4-dioxygenase beta subunit
MTRTLLAVVMWLAQATAPASNEDTGQVRGRVTDKETGRPLPYVQVELVERPRMLQRSAMTDDAGVFQFTRLPAGSYDGIVIPGPHRGSHEFKTLVANPPPTTFDLPKGAVREFNVALSRTQAIPVRAVDEFGDPLSDIQFKVFQAPGMNRVSSPFQQRTDDRGRMRVFGLPPGRYVVCAEVSGIDGTSASDGPRERLLPTCYPSAASEADGQPVVVGTGTVEEIEIRMRRGRTFTVSGTVLDAAGAPAERPFVSLNAYAGGSSGGRGVIAGADGRFRIDRVAAGSYAIAASIGGPDRPQDRRAREVAFIPIRVDSDDVTGMVVTLQKGVDVPGRIVLEDPSQVLPPDEGGGVSVWARLANDALPGSGSKLYDHAQSDRTFTLRGMFGRRVLGFTNVPRGFYVKQVRYRGRDIIDTPIDFAQGGEAGSIEVILSNRGATVTGRVLDDRATPVRRAHVWLLRVDGDAATDVIGETSTPENGEFRFGPLRPGEYVAVAFATRVPEFERADHARAVKLVSLGERVRLTEFDERSIDLRVIKEEPR